MDRLPPTLIARVGIITVLLAYVLAFASLYHVVGSGVVALSLLPVVTVAWSFGGRAGLAAGLAITPLNLVLLNLVGAPGWAILTHGGLPGSVALVLIGAAVSYQRDLVTRGRAQAAALLEQIGERERAELARRAAERQYRTLVEQVPAIIYTARLDAAASILYVSPHVELLLGYPPAYWLADPTCWTLHIHPQDRALVQEMLAQLRATQVAQSSDYRMLARDGREVWFHVTATVVRDAQGAPFCMQGVMLDITERKQAEAELIRRGLYDPLTGLPNRTLLLERLRHAIHRRQRQGAVTFAVLFLDLDNFKTINDSLGHLVGDHLLVGIARRLEACLRPGDTAARLGGDEFALLVEDLQTPADIEPIARRIQQELQVPFTLDGRDVYTSASIGIVYGTPTVQHPEELLRDADMAMYQAKHEGKARHALFDVALHTRALARLALEAELRRALTQEEFVLHYQPVVAVVTGSVVGYEALVRWHHPVRGIVSPGEFLPLAEETGLIVPLGAWVLQTACRHAKAWHNQGPTKPWVAVNVSARQFRHDDFAAQVAQILTDTGLPPAYLDLELTESSLMEQTDATLIMLQSLRQLGVHLSIDDFGIGYSSLGYLKRFPLTTLKIDRSFVREIATSVQDRTLVGSIIALAHSLGLRVTAEGIETDEQRTVLVSQGCDALQGYLLGRPGPASEVRSCAEISNQLYVRAGTSIPTH